MLEGSPAVIRRVPLYKTVDMLREQEAHALPVDPVVGVGGSLATINPDAQRVTIRAAYMSWLDVCYTCMFRHRAVFLNLFCLATQNVYCNLSATPAS